MNQSNRGKSASLIKERLVANREIFILRSYSQRQMHTHTHTNTDTHSQTDKHTQTQTQKHTHTHTHTHLDHGRPAFKNIDEIHMHLFPSAFH